MSLSAKLQLMMAMYGMFASDMKNDLYSSNYVSDNEMRDKIREMRKKQILQKGCKEFDFGNVTIIALNQKNADKKYQKYLKLKKDEN